MPVEDPGTLIVTCDQCSEQVEMETTHYAGDPVTYGVDDDTLNEYGWIRDGGDYVCPDCINAED